MAALERVGLAHKAQAECRALSGGQQQRVAIARTLMQDAEIIIADEPVASLDPKAGREIMDLLLDVVTERGMTVLCTLHQLERPAIRRPYCGDESRKNCPGLATPTGRIRRYAATVSRRDPCRSTTAFDPYSFNARFPTNCRRAAHAY